MSTPNLARLRRICLALPGAHENELIEDGYRLVAPKRFLRQLEER